MLQSFRVLSRRFSSHKAATGLVGLPVSEDGVQELKDVSTKILSEIQVGLYLFVLVGREQAGLWYWSVFFCVVPSQAF